MFLKRLSVALSPFFLALTPGIALSEALPDVPSSEINNLACYVQTEEGQTVDLTRLCGGFYSNSIAKGSGIDNPTGGYARASSVNPLSGAASSRSRHKPLRSKSSSSTFQNSRRNRWTYLPVDSGLVIDGYADLGTSGGSSGGGSDGPVQVHGYTRKNGTTVRPHTRSAPSR